ncbi:MAG: LamG domain-containing protein, partial [Patescibacteria group bacterium]|nr:LamG domain-containing protein [Patescibacteria group bacterium]
FESDKYQQTAANSGNPDPTTYAIGSNLSITPFIHGLVGYWPLNEGSGSTAYDNSGWNNNGSLLDATTTDTGPTWTTTGCLNGGSCLSFDGSNDYIAISSLNNGGSLSFSIWINSSSYNSKIPISLSSSANGTYGPDAYFNCSEINWNKGDGCNNPFSNSTYPNSSWHNVIVVDNPTTNNASLYIDGTLVGTAGYLNPSVSNGEMHLGDYIDNNFFFPGKISYVTLFDKTLSAAEAKAIYNAVNP